MKKTILISVAVIAYCVLQTAICFSQGTAINSTGAPADNSAILDAGSTSKGMLIPRMTTAQCNAIVSPAVGLIIFDTDINCFRFWTGAAWLNECGSQSSGSGVTAPCSATGGTASANPASGSCGYTTTLTVSGYNGNIQWQRSTDGLYFIDIANETNPVCTVAIYDTITYFAAKVDIGSCATGYSNVVKVTANGCPALSCTTFGWKSSEFAYSVIQTSDGGYAIGGNASSFSQGAEDASIIKTDDKGSISWSRNIGGVNSDYCYSVVETSDGGYAIGGYTSSFGAGSTDLYMAKFDGNGNLQWTKTTGSGSDDGSFSMIQTSDGGYAIAGWTPTYGAGSYDVYLVKTDGNGNISWTKTYGGGGQEFAYSIIQTSDGGYAMTGFTETYGNNVYVVKTDASGALQWTKSIGGSGYEFGYSIVQTSDGGYAVAGYTASYGAGNYDVYVFKLNSSGALQWTKTIGGTNGDYSNSIINTGDGGLAIAGNTSSYGAGGSDMFIIKLSDSGVLQWAKTIGGSGSDLANSIIQSSDGGYVVAGYTSSNGAGDTDFYIVKTDSNGNSCCSATQSPSVSSGGSESSGGSAGTGGGTTGSGGKVKTGGTKTTVCN